MKNDNMASAHSGHRERLRTLYIKSGLNGFADHNILEILLFFSIPRGDTNETAHRLIAEFGSFSGVFKASFDDLCRVKGVGRRTATLITLVGDITRELNSEACKQQIKTVESAEDAVNILRPKFVGAVNELFAILCLDNRGCILKCSLISSGGIDFVRADIRSVVAEILNCKATAVFMAHNHPHGFPVPSENDISVTKELSSILSAFSIRIVDHVIFSEDDFTLMSSNRNAAPYLNISHSVRQNDHRLLSDKK